MKAGKSRLVRAASSAFLVLLLAASTAGEAAISSRELVARLDRARATAERGLSIPSPEQMDAVRSDLGLPVTVDLDGWSVAIPADPFLESLDGSAPQDFRRAIQHLDALLCDAAAVRSAMGVGDEEIRSTLDRAYEGIDGKLGLVARIRRAVTDFVASILQGLARFSGVGSIVAWGLVALIAWLVARARLVPERMVRDRSVDSGAAAERDWRRAAEEALGRGDLREAVRLLYRDLLAGLAHRGLLTDSPTVTAGECRDRIRASSPAIYPAVAEATSAFERVVYGRAAAVAGDVEALQRAEHLARRG